MHENLSEFLLKYKNLTPPHDSIREAVVRAVFEETGATLQKRHVRIVRSDVYIDAASHLKNIIYLKKENLLKKLSSEFGEKSPQNIL